MLKQDKFIQRRMLLMEGWRRFYIRFVRVPCRWERHHKLMIRLYYSDRWCFMIYFVPALGGLGPRKKCYSRITRKLVKYHFNSCAKRIYHNRPQALVLEMVTAVIVLAIVLKA